MSMIGSPGAQASGQAATPPPVFSGRVNWTGKRIWSVGDSTTLGTTDNPSCAWRPVLANSLRAAGHIPNWVGTLNTGFSCTSCTGNLMFMRHEGHSGFKSSDISTNLAAYYAAIGSFDAVLLHIGINDLIADATNGTSLAAGAFDTLLASLVALNPTGWFFIANLIPCLIGDGSWVANYNAHVAATVATYTTTKMYLVNQHSALIQAPSSDFTAGNIHPLDVGYAKMAPPWQAAMEAAA